MLLLLLVLSLSAACPPSQRFDVDQFPPRCIDCPTSILTNRVPLMRIAAQVRPRKAVKFSPGLPQNQTCGCYRAPANHTVSVELNSSWIVSGFAFAGSPDRWLREIAVEASDDNITFLAWGTYTFRNFTDASLALFTRPIRARFFRITVARYVNHRFATPGFPLDVWALASQTQPFRCACPTLSSGYCCPYINMTVRNDTCVWCMDPSHIDTVMTPDGCGQCKTGTFEWEGKCIRRRPTRGVNALDLLAIWSDGLRWKVNVSVTTDSPNTSIGLWLISDRGATPAEQYMQFDRGRGTLTMNKELIRQRAACTADSVCAIRLEARFQTPAGPMVVITRPLEMNTAIPTLVTMMPGPAPAALARLELHRTADGAWALSVTGVILRGEIVWVAWNHNRTATAYRNTGGPMIGINPPPENRTHLSVISGSTRLVAHSPIRIVDHAPTTVAQLLGITVEITYGLGFATQPTPGDSEQIIFITARSPQPIRLKRLMLTAVGGPGVLYTNAKGFIIDTTRVLDLTIACTGPSSAMHSWLARAIGVLPAPELLAPFVAASCARPASKAYWLAPLRATTPRTASVSMQVLAEFA